jgi:cytochrome c oxidase assembly factor CtaG
MSDRRTSEIFVTGVWLLLGIAWIYLGVDRGDGAEGSGWFISAMAAHLLASAYIAKWRVLLIPAALFLAALLAGAHSGPGDTPTAGVIFFYELFLGLPLICAGVLIGRRARGMPAFTAPDPWR